MSLCVSDGYYQTEGVVRLLCVTCIYREDTRITRSKHFNANPAPSLMTFRARVRFLSLACHVIQMYSVFLLLSSWYRKEGRKDIFYLTTHSTHFIYGYMTSDIWLRTILIVRKETRCRHIGYSFRLVARVLLYAPNHRQDNTYHGLCYTSRVLV